MSTGDPSPTASAKPIEASKDGLSKSQIRRLFHGHVETNRTDAALETLVTPGALTNYSEASGGRPSSLWSAMEENEPEQDERSVVGDESPPEDH